jgi:hypothetical protein
MKTIKQILPLAVLAMLMLASVPLQAQPPPPPPPARGPIDQGLFVFICVTLFYAHRFLTSREAGKETTLSAD